MGNEEVGALAEWLEGIGIGVHARRNAGGLDIDEGEARFTVRQRGASTWEVIAYVRDDDRGPQIRSERWEDIERYLLMLYFGAIRRKKGLSPMRPLAADGIEAQEGYSISAHEGGGVVLTAPDSRAVWFASEAKAASFSRYDRFSADELRAQALSPETDLAVP